MRSEITITPTLAIRHAVELGMQFIRDNLEACSDCDSHTLPEEKCPQCQEDIAAIQNLRAILSAMDEQALCAGQPALN